MPQKVIACRIHGMQLFTEPSDGSVWLAYYLGKPHGPIGGSVKQLHAFKRMQLEIELHFQLHAINRMQLFHRPSSWSVRLA